MALRTYFGPYVDTYVGKGTALTNAEIDAAYPLAQNPDKNPALKDLVNYIDANPTNSFVSKFHASYIKNLEFALAEQFITQQNTFTTAIQDAVSKAINFVGTIVATVTSEASAIELNDGTQGTRYTTAGNFFKIDATNATQLYYIKLNNVTYPVKKGYSVIVNSSGGFDVLATEGSATVNQGTNIIVDETLGPGNYRVSLAPAVTNSITAVQNNVTSLQGQVTPLLTLPARVTTAETEIDQLQALTNPIPTQIGTLQGRATQLESGLSALTGTVNGHTTSLQTQGNNINALFAENDVEQANIQKLTASYAVTMNTLLARLKSMDLVLRSILETAEITNVDSPSTNLKNAYTAISTSVPLASVVPNITTISTMDFTTITPVNYLTTATQAQGSAQNVAPVAPAPAPAPGPGDLTP
jgi:hypothetical protein